MHFAQMHVLSIVSINQREFLFKILSFFLKKMADSTLKCDIRVRYAVLLKYTTSGGL